ncbi:hypothetical protein HDU98_002693 [Podochytrium sp. JEL0797]|nr:hypothetical protein HDU98_002693 [Podochytrium sp. JEL0797]
MIALLPAFSFLAISALASPVPYPIPRVPYGCQTPGQASIVFRTLDSNTLNVLKANQLSATFFIRPETVDPALATNALAQGHSFGLAIPMVEGLIKDCLDPTRGPCDHPIYSDRLGAFLRSETSLWSTATPNAALKVVAFTNLTRISLTGGFMYPQEYTTLLSDTFQIGYTPVVAGYGQDTPNESSAAETDFFLSNFFGDAWIAKTPALDANAKFLATREVVGVNLEDVNVVVAAAQFLQSNHNTTIVSISKCLGYPVN